MGDWGPVVIAIIIKILLFFTCASCIWFCCKRKRKGTVIYGPSFIVVPEQSAGRSEIFTTQNCAPGGVHPGSDGIPPYSAVASPMPSATIGVPVGSTEYSSQPPSYIEAVSQAPNRSSECAKQTPHNPNNQ